jgi:pimeloyl-ACP methyl ester carboxylesterase
MTSLTRKAALLLLAGALALPVLSAAQASPNPEIHAATAQAFSSVERRALTADVAEYFFKVRVGSGPYDEIGVHRVVKEIAPNVPVHATDALFLAAGDIWSFRAAFLTGAHPLPVFLAENGVDVWGIDYRWTLVPATVTDFSFMKDWGLEQDARDLGVALGVTRFTRALTGSGFGKIDLLGWSRGGQIGYAYLNGESQVPSGLRQVKGFIPVDIYLKTDVAQLQALACQRQQNTEATIAGGGFANPSGDLIATLGVLAATDPNGSSFLNGPPFNLPGYTNRQAGLLVGEATFAFLAGLEPTPFYHFTGGTFDAEGKPAGLLYSNEADLFTFEQASAPFQPNQELADADASTCGQTDVAFDDHLADIKVPVLYIGAGGGFGEFGIYTTTLLGSTDVTTHIVHKVPADQRLADYGHADLFLANDAQTLVWQPILDWVQAH